MTYKQLADKLGVKKDRIRYLAEHLNIPDATYRVDGVIHLSQVAVDMIFAQLHGIPHSDFAVSTCVHTDGTANYDDDSGNSGCESCENACNECENREQSRNECENDRETALTIIDHYKTVILEQSEQLKAKDEQFKTMLEWATASQSAAAEQLKTKDEQLKRMQDTIDELTRQLAERAEEAAERERQSREETRRWWQWWKR